MKGYLKTIEGALLLQPRTTVVGRREDCDLCLQSGGVEERHALIELSEAEGCFLLRDLNSAHGTFVNDCRIHNATVRLAPGDQLHFGYGGHTYELAVDTSPSLSCPPVSQRSAWQSHLQLIEEPRAPSPPAPVSQLPFLPSHPPTHNSWIQGVPTAAPHPPVRPRPASAGARRAGLGHPSEHGVPSLRPELKTSTSLGNGAVPPSPLTVEHLLQEKEGRLLRLGDEVSRLLLFEAESRRKDAVIASLRDEVSALRHRAAHSRGDPDIRHKLQGLEREISAKKEQIQELKEQMMQFQKDSSEAPQHKALSERDLQITNLKNQLEKVKKDNSMSAGLVTSLQRDLSTRDKQALRLTTEVDKLRQDVRHKDAQLGAMSAKFSKMREAKKHEQELVAREKEVLALQKRVEELQQKQTAIQSEHERCLAERDTLSHGLAEASQVQAELREELQRGRQRLQELGRREQGVRVELEQTQARLERFRSRIIQATYTAPGVSAPQDSVSDEQVIEQMSGIIEGREELKARLQELQEQLKARASEQDKMASDTEPLQRALQECQSRAQGARSVPALQREVAALRDLCVPASLAWVQSAALGFLHTLLSWHQEAAQALQDAEIDATDSEGVPVCIRALWQQRQDRDGEIRNLQAELEALRGSRDGEVQARVDALREEQDRKLAALKEASEQQSRQLLEEALRAERQRMDEALTEERRGLKRLESQHTELTQAMEAKCQEEERLLRRQEELSRELESVRRAEAALREEAQGQEALRLAELQAAEERGAQGERERRREQEAEYREQVRQHARTIVALEQRLVSVSRSQQAGEEERVALRARLREAEKRLESSAPVLSPAPPLPAVSPELMALEQTCTALRAELADTQREASAHRDIIVGLSRDLAGANARMSDMTGELSEKQKLDLEQTRALVVQQRGELSMLREQLAQMSQLVDQKGEELRRVGDELRGCRAELEQQTGVVRESKLRSERTQEDRGASSPAPPHSPPGLQDTTTASDLADQGSKCRGHRHEEVIQRQKEALAELRGRIKALEQTRPLVSPQGQGAQQVALMRRELSELKARQAAGGGLSNGAAEEHSPSCKAQLPLPGVSCEEALERTARLDQSEALDLSERTYLDLVRALSAALELGELSGCTSLKHVPQDERDRLGVQRQQDLELLRTRLRLLHGQSQRKEELLSEYQADLHRLRESQAVGQRQQAELDRLREELQGQRQESGLLREALDRTQRRLEQEKGLNRAIKERKTFHLEQLDKRTVKTPTHSCAQEDIHGKGSAKKASLQGKLKKKDYEIEALKKHLRKQDQELCSTTAQLVNLQNSLV
ncbi:forkhead-associated domain-containing protein 1 isoform X1 [Amia ocellicauda]|uniref:forkhead-associated domain-containing protein 1 isoform X1 n=1 Tax=Amia ocellicauda TaxID=2972642 RepID=UPI003464D9C4